MDRDYTKKKKTYIWIYFSHIIIFNYTRCPSISGHPIYIISLKTKADKAQQIYVHEIKWS